MTPTTYTYNEAMEIVEKFMKDSKIREFCTDYCKGLCCSSCHIEPCRKTKKRRITCSIFVCSELQQLLLHKQNNKNIYLEARKRIAMALENAGHRGCCYFKPHSQQTRAEFEISRRPLDALEEIDMYTISSRVYRIETFARRYATTHKEK